VATNLSYPVADLLMLGLICGLLVIGRGRLDRRFLLMAAGIVCFWASDSVYLVKAAEGTWQSGGPYDPGWWAIAVCFAAAAWMRPRGRRGALRHRALISAPIAFALLSLLVLVAGSLMDVSLPAVGLASGALLSVLARLALTFRAHQAVLERTRDEASTDPLTGLGNRRHLMGDLARVIEEGRPAALAIFDLDGFKDYNDRFGHPAGDALLVRLTAALRESVAGPGSAYRLGGDEFCVLADGVDGNALDLRLKEWTGCFSERGEGFCITASSGVALIPEEAADPSAALRLCDRRMYARKHSRRATPASQTRDALLAALAACREDLDEHAGGLAAAAERVGARLGVTGAWLQDLSHAADLHDIGKVALPASILTKPGPLTDEEWEFVERHPVIGERILAAAPALASAARIVRSTHERYDGTGYPDRLAGDQIPLQARVISVCDAYRAMTSDRSYRRALGHSRALDELRRCAGGQFDPTVVEAFVRAFADAPPGDRFVEPFPGDDPAEPAAAAAL
jgi:two-component system cell cycle response regulator